LGEIELKNCYFTSDCGASVKHVNDMFNEMSRENNNKLEQKNKNSGSLSGFGSQSRQIKSYTLIRSRTSNINRVMENKSEPVEKRNINKKKPQNLKNVLKNISFKIRKG